LDSQGPYIGIGVAKDQLDIATRPTTDIWSVTMDPHDIAELVHQLTEWQPHLGVLEATGGFQKRLEPIGLI